MHIAICDDNIYAVSKLEELIEGVLQNSLDSSQHETFPSGDELLAYLEAHPRSFHLYLLDIEMPGTNGMETARIIRQGDSEALIVFITSHTEMMSEAFGVYAFQFLPKPFDEDAVSGVILKAARLLQDRRTLFHFKIGKSNYSLYRSQITSMESFGRKITLHTLGGENHDYYGTLKGALEQVNGTVFVQVHSSHVVNMAQLERVNADHLLLRDGRTVPVGKTFHAAFHSAYRSYVLSQTV